MTEGEYRYTDADSDELTEEVNPYDIHFVYYVEGECHVIIACSTRPFTFINQMCVAGLTQTRMFDIYPEIPNEVHIARMKQ